MDLVLPYISHFLYKQKEGLHEKKILELLDDNGISIDWSINLMNVVLLEKKQLVKTYTNTFSKQDAR